MDHISVTLSRRVNIVYHTCLKFASGDRDFLCDFGGKAIYVKPSAFYSNIQKNIRTNLIKSKMNKNLRPTRKNPLSACTGAADFKNE